MNGAGSAESWDITITTVSMTSGPGSALCCRGILAARAKAIEPGRLYHHVTPSTGISDSLCTAGSTGVAVDLDLDQVAVDLDHTGCCGRSASYGVTVAGRFWEHCTGTVDHEWVMIKSDRACPAGPASYGWPLMRTTPCGEHAMSTHCGSTSVDTG